MNAQHFLAFDLGAGSGRTILGSIDNDKIELKEMNRFANNMIELNGHLHWDFALLFEEIKNGMSLCSSKVTKEPAGMAVDTWGVDFGLLARDGSVLGLPYAYRDSRTNNTMEEFFKKVSRKRVYQLTGIQFMQINTLFQLYSMVRDKSPILEVATDLLTMPNLFNYLLTGQRKSEFTHSTTTQLYNPTNRNWDNELFQALGISNGIMPEIVQPGTVIDNLNESICRETGLKQTPIIASGSHDTASAVAAVPAEGKDWVYISSGTWCLMGVEADKPILNEKALEFNFTNEGGVGGTFRFLKNIMGLWLVQECKRIWDREREYDWDELTQMADSAKPLQSLIDPDNEAFLNPSDMPEAIARFCRDTGQSALESREQMIRCALESLALKFRLVIEQLKQVYEHPINRMHIIGGGCRNKLLCQFAADATGLPVIAGPVEATACGNILIQAMAKGQLASVSDIRKVVKESVEVVEYEPSQTQQWNDAYGRFRNLVTA